ncbi:1,6-anhydro-N-acetylmuramate kinase/predicted acetyltransferase [Agrobacterium vitis]|nr:1,6-anhydro-N-acetylmuramate kinase/predicted acetyltransferase [Agrobacterium vitis]MBE1438416.1 1,6-anhydro-N-acetylmuramate kinase/predicted acetyltransferase [Agrobacterium vitis]
MSKIYRALGLMSGTSMDGIDVAMLTTDGLGKLERGPFLSIPYDDGFRAMLRQGLEDAKTITERQQRPGDLRVLEEALTLHHAAAVKAFLAAHQLRSRDMDVIGFHGQTVLHRPDQALTVQIGDGALLARETGIDVVYDMRANDMTHGGQGAPLVPVYHAALAASMGAAQRPVCFVNIGGISNLTFIGADGEIIAFDSGPGNTLIDQWVEGQTGKAFDAGGEIAAKGKVVPALADAYLNHRFFTANTRRSLDRNDFAPPKPGDATLEDGARTLAHLAAASIFASARHLPQKPKTYIICGGGRLNAVIMADLVAMAKAQAAEVINADDLALDGDAMEAEAWAYLAARALKSLPLTFPGTTGVTAAVTGGVHRIPVVCETERLILTPWRAGDAALLADLHSTPETSRFVSTGEPWSLDYAVQRIEGWMDEYEGGGVGTGKLKLIAKDDGRFIGRAGFSWSDDSGEFELGYSIGRQEWGKGFATEIGKGLMAWFSMQAPHQRFIAFAHVDNAASLAVLRKIGLRELDVRLHKGRPFQFFDNMSGT